MTTENKNPQELANKFFMDNVGKSYGFIKNYSQWLLILAEDYAIPPELRDSLDK